MAKRQKTSRTEEMEQFDSPVEMLEADHAKVKTLFDKFEESGDRMTKAKQQIVEEVFAELEVHTQLEEEIFYPALKALGEREGKKLIAESIEEHQVVKTLMEDMRALSPQDEQYEAKFMVLMENVRHHIEEEEDEMFPMAEEELDDEMDSLLAQMLERKQAIMASQP
jgi:hemerythrin-like domain-containing protein